MDRRVVGIAQTGSARRHHIQHRPHFCWGAADDAQDFRGLRIPSIILFQLSLQLLDQLIRTGSRNWGMHQDIQILRTLAHKENLTNRSRAEGILCWASARAYAFIRLEISPKPGMRCSCCGGGVAAGRGHPLLAGGQKPRQANGPCIGSKGCTLAGVSPGRATDHPCLKLAGAASKAADLGGERPLPSIARFGRLAYPMCGEVTTRTLLGCKRHGCPGTRKDASGGNDLGGKQTRRPEDYRMTAAA